MDVLIYNGRIIPAEKAPPALPQSVFRAQEGLFESMLAIEGTVQLAHYHQERLRSGLSRLGFRSFPGLDKAWQELLPELLAQADTPYNKVRIQVFAEQGTYSYLIEANPISADVFAFNEKGLTLGILETSLKPFDETGNLKTINPALYTEAAAHAKKAGWDDVLLQHEGFIVESGVANIFWTEGKTIYTPPLAGGCIAGTMRRYLMDKLTQAYDIREERLSPERLYQAGEVFLTNAVRRIKWIGNIGSRTYSNHLASELYSKLFS